MASLLEESPSSESWSLSLASLLRNARSATAMSLGERGLPAFLRFSTFDFFFVFFGVISGTAVFWRLFVCVLLHWLGYQLSR